VRLLPHAHTHTQTHTRVHTRIHTHIQTPEPTRPAQVLAALPFNVSVALAFHLIFYGMAGLRHGAAYVARSALVAVLLSLFSMQARAVGV
jgi:hypothetical protein